MQWAPDCNHGETVGCCPNPTWGAAVLAIVTLRYQCSKILSGDAVARLWFDVVNRSFHKCAQVAITAHLRTRRTSPVNATTSRPGKIGGLFHTRVIGAMASVLSPRTKTNPLP